MAKAEIEAPPMKSQTCARRLALALGATVALFALGQPTPALPGDAAPVSSVSTSEGAVKSLQLGVGRSVIVDLPEDAAEIFVGEPKVANAVVRSARRLYVSSLAAGQTTIFALAADGRKIAVLDISVGRDVGELATLLNAAIPGNDIHVRTVADSIILTGSVASAGDAQKALDIASGFLNEDKTTGADGKQTAQVQGKVVNSLIIRGLDQVSMRVTVSEIRRDILKQLGVNMLGSTGRGSYLTLSNPFSVNGEVPAGLLPGGYTAAAAGALGTLSWSRGAETFAAQLEALEQQGVVRTLAEPTVTAVSGESAKFLAGGTIPIPNGETCAATTGCTISYVQQPYGVTLNFTPVVLSPGRIQLHIATEVTDIDNTRSRSIADTTIPGFRTRRNETTVELPSGGSIVTAGLISTQSQQAIDGVPGLMNLPVLGALFRSRDYQRDETELLVVVTPYIVHAIDPRDASLPTDNFADASDPQAWLLGRVNRIYSTAGGQQSMSRYTGKVGFITD
jgi:pilus assembly protein CpaC